MVVGITIGPSVSDVGLWCLDEVVVEKKLVQILGSASGREGIFQKLLLTCRTSITFLEFLCFKDGT